jgi:DNA-3-methyladenine glycosylase I
VAATVRRWLLTDDRGVTRCWWCGDDPLYRRYHDTEWGFPQADDDRLYEKLCLEGFQSGLSWLTILRKREGFRAAFQGFQIARVARLGAGDVARLLRNPAIVRHRGKIASAINNAQRARMLQEEFGSLAAFVWRHAPTRPRPVPVHGSALPARTDASMALAKALRARGWSFVGPTTVYAFMQATGMVNDHLAGCDARARVEAARQRFVPPC